MRLDGGKGREGELQGAHSAGGRKTLREEITFPRNPATGGTAFLICWIIVKATRVAMKSAQIFITDMSFGQSF